MDYAACAVQMMQREMAGEGAELSEDDVMALVKDVRREIIDGDLRIVTASPRAAADTPSYPCRLRSP